MAYLFTVNSYYSLGAFAKLRKATISFVMSVRLSAWSISAPTGPTFMKFYIWAFFENVSGKFKLNYSRTSIKRTSHSDQYTFFIVSRWVLKMKNVSHISCREYRNTHFVFNDFFFENLTVYEIMWTNTVQRGRTHALCMLDIYGYKHTLRICNTYCISTATMVTGKRLYVTFYVHCLVFFTLVFSDFQHR